MIQDPRAWARLGHALKTAREAKGLEQEELAELANVSRGSVQNAEKGEPPRSRMPPSVRPIASALGWPSGTVDAILEGDDPPGGWKDVVVRERIPARNLENILASAMVRATTGVTANEIREAVRIAVEELRREGVVSEEE